MKDSPNIRPMEFNRFDIAPETKLWRYMSFAKFVCLLRTRNLVLTPAYKFDDPYEGASGKASSLEDMARFFTQMISDKVQHDSVAQEVRDFASNPDRVNVVMQEVIRTIAKIGESNRYFTFVNCWHENETESEAMWKLYTAHQPEGIAIQTTYSALKRAINDSDVQIGRVTYRDYDNSFLVPDSFFWYKRKSFEHEREVRVMVEVTDEDRQELQKNYNSNMGITALLPVEMDVLVEKVYVSPYAQSWFNELVKDVMASYGLSKPVLYSQLNEQALFFPSPKQIFQLAKKQKT